MDFEKSDTDSTRLLAPLDWEYYPQKSIVIDDIDDDESLYYYDTDDEKEEEEYQKWLLWLNSDTFWKVPEYPDIMLEIFSRIPPKSLLKFQTISKTFLDLTKQHYFLSKQYDYSRGAIAGFFGQSLLTRDDFFETPNDLDEIRYVILTSYLYSLPDPALEFAAQKSSDIVMLIDSCNGLLLCINFNNKFIRTCIVCNPITREKVALPHSCRRSTRVNHALMADLDEKGFFKYKVVCLFRGIKDERETKLLIFSSEKGEWEEMNANFPPMHHHTMMGSKVFLNRSLFWDCFEHHILVCHLDRKRSGRCFELIEAPHASLGRCLWNFNDKLICYCHSYEGDFPSWSLSTNNGNSEFKWKAQGSELFEILSREISSAGLESFFIKPRSNPQVRFEIIGHDHGLNMIYIWFKDLIFSYSLWNGEMDVAEQFDDVDGCHLEKLDRRCKFESRTCVVAYRPSLAQIQTARKGKANEKEEIKEDNIEKVSVIGSVEERVCDVISSYENFANNVKLKGRKKKSVKHEVNNIKWDEEEKDDLFELIKKDNNDFASSLNGGSSNKAKRRQRKAKKT